MSTYTVPQFEIRHRLELALEAAGLEADQMANALGVTKTTIYNYMSGARNPKLGMVRQWALICRVPWQWIITGELPGPDDDDEVLINRLTQREAADNWGDNLRLLKLAA